MNKLQKWLNNESKTVSAECKSSEREYALTYEGSSQPEVWEYSFENLAKVKNGIGNTLSEFVHNITGQEFDLTNEDTILKMYMSQGWNINLTIKKGVYEAWATKTIVETDSAYEKEDRYGQSSTIEGLMNFLFINYDENDPYVLAKKEELDHYRNIFNIQKDKS